MCSSTVRDDASFILAVCFESNTDVPEALQRVVFPVFVFPAAQRARCLYPPAPSRLGFVFFVVVVSLFFFDVPQSFFSVLDDQRHP